jgi:hypothetical protein
MADVPYETPELLDRNINSFHCATSMSTSRDPTPRQLH